MKIHYYQDPGHGWIKVPKKKLVELGIHTEISRYSYMRGSFAYLEEDCDAPRFINALKAHGETYETVEHHADRRSPIRGYEHYLGGVVIDKLIDGMILRIPGSDER